MITNIKALIFDIDGVITDGKKYIDKYGNEMKSICYKDLDAISEFKKKGFIVGMITGEKGEFIDAFQRNFQVDYLKKDCKDKKKAIQEFEERFHIAQSEICYIGDGKYDIPAAEIVGLSICPNDAIDELKEKVKVILKRRGGQGCIAEIFTLLQLCYQT